MHKHATTPRQAVAAVAALCFVIAGCTSSKSDDSASGSGVETASTTQPSDSSLDAAPSAAISQATFAPLNQAVGYGLLRSISLEERPHPRDVVIYQALPNEMPRVAGIITTVEQTPLAHVNLRAVQDKIPNAYVKDVLNDDRVEALLGRYVKYTVTADGFTLEPATQQAVEQHHASARPANEQIPERDLTVTEIAALSDIDAADWKAFGVKAANVAALRRMDLDNVVVPDGYAVPFSFYDEFMTSNRLYDRVKSLLADPSFRRDPDVQDRELETLRKAILDGEMPTSLAKKLVDVQQRFGDNASIRCRSSTNNEDLPNFNGAGLYNSKTQRPEEGPLTKCIQQVYASVWNLRAFLERDFYRVDHLKTAMGVLLHPNASGEQVNGVAVSTDPIYETPGAYYVNAQRGEDLVTNPTAQSVPEALLLHDEGSVSVLSRSNLIAPGQRLLSDEQTAALRSALATIQTEFAKRYNPGDNKFAMEIEFKVTKDGAIQIKQARPWVFSEPLAS
jgi:hypothetical protein